MNSTNRVVNRMLLFVAGTVMLALGVAMVFSATRPRWATDAMGEVERAASSAWAWITSLPGIGAVPAAALLGGAATIAILALLIVFIGTRGGGATTTVLRRDAATGTTAVDRRTAQAVIVDPLLRRPDVVSAKVGAYRIGRASAIKLTVRMRRGAHTARVLHVAEGAIDEWDALAEVRIPVVLHLEGRAWTDRWRSATRVR